MGADSQLRNIAAVLRDARRPSRKKDVDQFKEKKRPKVMTQVPSARSNPETASDVAGQEGVGDVVAADRRDPVIEESELDQGILEELASGQ